MTVTHKGQETKAYIVQQAASLFNTKGYANGSMSELMQLTGLKKGGIYNHFQNKEEIAIEAFDYSINQVNQALYNVTKEQETAAGKLKAIITFYQDYPLNSVIIGGCPILNTAVEAADTNPLLKKRVQEAINQWTEALCKIMRFGIRNGEFREKANIEEVAIIIISQIEGGIVLTRSFGDTKYMSIVAHQLLNYVDTELGL